MVAVDHAPTLRLKAESQSPLLPGRSRIGRRQGVAQHQRPVMLGVFVGEIQANDAPERFSHIHHILHLQMVQDASQVINEDIQEVSYWSSSMTDQPIPLISGKQNTELAGQREYPVVPGFPLRENLSCNSMVGVDRHGSVKSAS